MMATEFHFECVNKKRGICIETGTAGCEYDCQKMRCQHCIYKDRDKRRGPCDICFIKVLEEK